MRRRHESAGPAGDVHAVREKRDAQPVVELRVARALEALEAELERIEVRWIERQPGRIGKDDEHRRLAEYAPRHAFLDQDAAQAGAQLVRGRLGARAGIARRSEEHTSELQSQ